MTKKTQTPKADIGAPLTVAIDDGYAQTKLYGKGADGKTVKFKMRSSVRPGRDGLTAISGSGVVGSYTTEEGEKFTVSEEIESESTMFNGFHTSAMNRVLVHHALLHGGFGGQGVNIMAGLPVDDYFLDGEKNEDKIAAKKANLAKGVENAGASKSLAELVNIDIGCQAVAAFLDFVLDDSLNERFQSDGKVAVVDIGGRTTDIAVIVNGQNIDNQMSGTANIGVLDVYSAVNKAVGKQFDFQDKLPINVIDAAIRDGKITLWGEDQDISAIVEATVQEQEGKIAREIERRLGSAASLRKVLFVGGGSALFKNIAARFRNGVMSDDPEFANARGMYKFACLKNAS